MYNIYIIGQCFVALSYNFSPQSQIQIIRKCGPFLITYGMTLLPLGNVSRFQHYRTCNKNLEAKLDTNFVTPIAPRFDLRKVERYLDEIPTLPR